jgi:hypothetical protein
MAPPMTSTKPWLGMLLERPRPLHRRMNIAAADAGLTLQAACFVAFEKFLRCRGSSLTEEATPVTYQA